jgi:hypothetical protein
LLAAVFEGPCLLLAATPRKAGFFSSEGLVVVVRQLTAVLEGRCLLLAAIPREAGFLGLEG